MKLANKIAVVTGASKGIGRAIAVALSKDGADVAVNYVRDAIGAKETATAVEAAGRRSLLVQADVGRAEAVPDDGPGRLLRL